MSTYDLIPEDTYQQLPEDPMSKFVTLVGVAQANLQRLLDDSNSNNFSEEIRSQFIAVIQGTAQALGVAGLEQFKPGVSYAEYTSFQVRLAGIVAMVRLQNQLVPKPHSVELGRVTKAKITQEIEQLRNYIEQSDLTERKKQALNDKLDDLLAELAQKRLSFARTMAIAASMMGLIAGTATVITDAPKIPNGIAYILALIGHDKLREDAETARLAPPPLLITASTPLGVGFDSLADDLDDDVPF